MPNPSIKIWKVFGFKMNTGFVVWKEHLCKLGVANWKNFHHYSCKNDIFHQHEDQKLENGRFVGFNVGFDSSLDLIQHFFTTPSSLFGLRLSKHKKVFTQNIYVMTNGDDKR